MEAGKRFVNDFFNGNKKLIVPFFQRSYVWTEDQWKRFLSDMQFISDNNSEYFLGSVILKQQNTSSDSVVGDQRTIIDGQQRLTTLSIFLKVLALRKNINSSAERLFILEDGTTAISHCFQCKERYEEIMNLTSLKDIQDSNNGIVLAYNYFKNAIDENATLDFNKIKNKIQFVGIDLQPNEDEQQIFDTINSLGVKLTTAELLKNYFYNVDSYEKYKREWVPIFESDDECRKYWSTEFTTGRLSRSNIEYFFYAFLQIKIQDKSLNLSTEDKSFFRKSSEGLFTNYKNFISKCGIDKEELLKEVLSYAQLYKQYFSTSILSETLSADNYIDRINVLIYGLDGTTMIPYILYVLKNVVDAAERDKIFKYLESYIIRRLICRSSNNNYSDLFTESLIGKEVLSCLDLQEYLSGKSEATSLSMPHDNDVVDGFNKSILTNVRAKGILYMMESKIRPGNMYSTTINGFNSYSLEHLMPKKWKNNWGVAVDEDRRNELVLTLGNLAIITSALNSSIRDSAWNDKLNGRGRYSGLTTYAAGLETMKDVLNKAVWNEDTIQERAKKMADVANNVWPYEYV